MSAPPITPTYPASPFKAEWSSVLSQDVVATASILVEATSPSPVGVFTNPASGGQTGNAEVEALAIVNTGTGKQLCHIARDRGTDGGWRVIPLFGGQSADQVAAAVAYAGTSASAVYGLFTDGPQLYSTTLGADGATWSAPAAVANGTLTSPRVAYSPAGRVVIYGANAEGNLVTAYQAQVGGAFMAVVCNVNGALGQGDFQLCLTDEQTFTILANINTKAYLITGLLGADHASSAPTEAPQFTDTLQQVVLGYWSPVQQTLMFLLVDDDKALHVWSENSASSSTVAQKIPNSSVQQATGYVALDQSLHVYAIDGEMKLWVLHQSARQPWRDDGTPNFAPFIPLDTGVARVVADMNPAAAPSLFALDGGDFSLRLHEQDATSRMWASDKVLQHSTEAYEVTRYRAEVRLTDGNGRALPRQQLKVATEAGASAVDVWAQGAVHQVDNNGVTLTTDAMGKLTLAVLASNGLACPNLVVSGAGLAAPVTVRPAGGLHDYLSGNGTLNPTNPGGALPVFDQDGKTLQAAKVNGSPLAPGTNDPKDPNAAPVAAAAIRNGALVALNKAQGQGVAGFTGSLRKDGMKFELFHSTQELVAYRSAALPQAADDFWDELKDFFGDVFEGIANAVISIAHFVVHVAEEVVDFTLEFAELSAQVLGLPIDGIERAAKFMTGVFNSVDAFIDKVVDWLKALFDFGAIWRTKMAIQTGVLGVPAYVKQLAGMAQQKADGWFVQQKQKLHEAFGSLENQYAGQTFAGQPNWQNPVGPPSNQPIAGGAAPSDFSNNPHHNWLQDKVSSYAPDSPGSLPTPPVDPWSAFAQHMNESGQEFQKALSKFKDAVLSIIQDPSSFATKTIPDLLNAVELLLDALLDLCDAIVDALAGLAESTMDTLETALQQELPLGFLNTLWSWIAGLAGYPNDSKLTLCALGSLAAAFPVTLIYKLTTSVDQEPFPDGKFPSASAAPLAAALQGIGIDMPFGCRLASDITRICQCLPGMIADVLGNDAPWWLTAIGVIFSVAVWVLQNGYPNLSVVEWASAAAVAQVMLVLTPIAYFTVKGYTWFKQLDRGDVADAAITAIGVFGLIFGVYQDIVGSPRTLKGVANLLIPLPSVFAFLNMSTFRDDPEVGPFALAGNLLEDTVGYIIGGSMLLVDTCSTRPQVASA
jgi:hypothetical protein